MAAGSRDRGPPETHAVSTLTVIGPANVAQGHAPSTHRCTMNVTTCIQLQTTHINHRQLEVSSIPMIEAIPGRKQ